MSISGAHADAFYPEILRDRQICTIRDSVGFAALAGEGGMRTMPFWSLVARREKPYP